MSTGAASPVRVLVVDDSAYMRHSLQQRLAAWPDLAVVGAARDGIEALELIPTLNPDVVTLDVEMPRMDGLATLRAVMSRSPRPVIMFSNLTAEGATATIQALLWGAVDFVAKPTLRGNLGQVVEELVKKIRVAAKAHPTLPRRAPLPTTPLTTARQHATVTAKRSSGDKVVVIGASTGGPGALATVLSQLPPDTPSALLIVQHMPIGFTRALAEHLDSVAPFTIKEAEDGDPLEVGKGLLAPAGYHMAIDKHGRVMLNQAPSRHGVRPAIDVTMETVASYTGRDAIGVVLTGMGNDGTLGATAIHASSGQVIAEDEATCVVWGMPRSVVSAGVADVVAPLPEIAPAIQRALRRN